MEERGQKHNTNSQLDGIIKCPTGIHGLDMVTNGGLPKGRTTLICGGTGCGKTLLGIEFLVRGATEFGEPGVLMAFEERQEEIVRNVASLGWDLDRLAKEQRLITDNVIIERSLIEETGGYELEGLFMRLGSAIEQVGAKRVLLDTTEILFAGLSNTAIIRSELRRLFGWLKEQGVTTIVTGERTDDALTRHGLEEFISDCVILLDNRVRNELTTRRLRIVKYRGSKHDTNEFAFLIGDQGLSVLPITSASLDHRVFDERVGSGIPELDAMLSGGVFRGSSVLINGGPGTGKTSIGFCFVNEVCLRGERALSVLFEESPLQAIRNMGSIGLDLEKWRSRGLLRIEAGRPSSQGVEQHLLRITDAVQEFNPQLVVIDPISNLPRNRETGSNNFVTRLVDYLKKEGVTAVFLELSHSGKNNVTETGVSSITDTWIQLRAHESQGERNHIMSIIKSRGMAHSNQDREYKITAKGIELAPVYVGPEGVLTGSLRVTQEARENATQIVRAQEIERLRRELEKTTSKHKAQTEVLNAEFESKHTELELQIRQAELENNTLGLDRDRMAALRGNPKQSTVQKMPEGRQNE